MRTDLPAAGPGPGAQGSRPGFDRNALLLVLLGLGLDIVASRWLMAQVPRWLPPQASTVAAG